MNTTSTDLFDFILANTITSKDLFHSVTAIVGNGSFNPEQHVTLNP